MQRRKIDESEIDRFFDFVGVGAGQDNPGYMGLQYRNGGSGVGITVSALHGENQLPGAVCLCVLIWHDVEDTFRTALKDRAGVKLKRYVPVPDYNAIALSLPGGVFLVDFNVDFLGLLFFQFGNAECQNTILVIGIDPLRINCAGKRKAP